MPFVAVLHTGKEAIFVNRPIKKENAFYSYSGEMIILPAGTIKKLTGKEITFNDEPIELNHETQSNPNQRDQGRHES